MSASVSLDESVELLSEESLLLSALRKRSKGHPCLAQLSCLIWMHQAEGPSTKTAPMGNGGGMVACSGKRGSQMAVLSIPSTLFKKLSS